jgi:hypothetical protein
LTTGGYQLSAQITATAAHIQHSLTLQQFRNDLPGAQE